MTSTGNTLETSGPIAEGVVGSTLGQDFEHSVSFLSISSKGDRVSISYLRTDKKTAYTTNQPECLIFRVNEQREIIFEESIEFQGRAVFLSNDNLALVNDRILNIYDYQNGYKLVKWFDLAPIFDDLLYPGLPNALKQGFFAFKTPFVNIPDRRQAHPVDNILHLTKLIQHDMIIATYKTEGSRIWALDRDGIRIISFNSPNPVHGNILNTSSDKKLVASFVQTALSINVYHVKTGLQAYQLKSSLSNNIKEQLNYDKRLVELDASSSIPLVNYVQFCSKSQYLFHISIYELKTKVGSSNALIIFEAWNIQAEKSIYLQEERITVDWKAKNSMIEPFVVETGALSGFPAFTAIYTSLLETGEWEFRSKDLFIYKKKSMTFWDINSINPSPTHVRSPNYEVNNDLHDWSHLTCLTSSDEQDCKFEYLLRFGIYTVQLWRICKTREKAKITDDDQLLYIRAFKAPSYHFNEAFNEKWIRNDQRKEKFPSNTDSASVDCTVRSTCSTMASPVVSRLSEHGIRFIESSRLVVNICHHKRYSLSIQNEQSIDYEWLEELYLPMYNTRLTDGESETKFACKDHHFFESVCQALHFLHTIYKDSREKSEISGRETLKPNFDIIYKKTLDLVTLSLKQLQKQKSIYFKTFAGSKILAMLSSFQDGREVLFKILETNDLQISLFSYLRKNAKTKIIGVATDRNENALTLLIQERDYRLYDLLLNRILLNSRYQGVGSFSAVSDTLVFLQDRDETDILRDTCKKLQYLQVDQSHFSFLNGEIVEAMNTDTLQKVSGYKFEEFISGTTNEQIISYNNNWNGRRLYNTVLYSKHLRNTLKIYKRKRNIKSKAQKSELITICVVPLVHFSSFAIFPGDLESNNARSVTNSSFFALFKCVLKYQNNMKQVGCYKEESDLLRFALRQRRHDLFHQNNSVLEVLLYYKWKTSIQSRFVLICCVHAVYYVSFFTAVLFSNECFGYTTDVSILKNPAHFTTIILMLISGGILGYQELHQLLKTRAFKFYDLFDYAAIILPVVNFSQMLTDKPGLYDVGAVTTIVLWIHGILRLRAIEFIGITLETIIKLIETVYKTLFIMLLLIIAFTHSFVVLLSHKDDSYFQEQFSGSVNLTESNLAADNVANYRDDSSSNSFKDPVKAFSSLWFFIYGVWDPISDGEAGDNYMIMFLAILFSFLTVLIFFNLVIALMSSKAEEVRTLGRGIWLSHFAAVIAEIELLWFFKSERTLSRNNPTCVYYVAKKIDVQKQIELLEDESEDLIKKLSAKYSKKNSS